MLADCMATLAGMTAASLVAMGRNGREFYDNQMSFEIGVTRFEGIFSRLTKGAITHSH
jgi:hypothetical protein